MAETAEICCETSCMF